MANHCCSGCSKESLGREGWLFLLMGEGWIISTMIANESHNAGWQAFGAIGQKVCSIVIGLVVLKLLCWPRSKKCDHQLDRTDPAHE